MEAPSNDRPETLRDEKARLLEAIAPLEPKCVVRGLPVTCTEVLVEFKAPAHSAFGEKIERPNYIRFRLGPDVAIALRMRSRVPGEAMVGQNQK